VEGLLLLKELSIPVIIPKIMIPTVLACGILK